MKKKSKENIAKLFEDVEKALDSAEVECDGCKKWMSSNISKMGGITIKAGELPMVIVNRYCKKCFPKLGLE